jgi:preprotein translocase subunit YajC
MCYRTGQFFLAKNRVIQEIQEDTLFQLLPVLQEAFGGGMAMLLPIGLIFVVFYFLIIRPQNKKQKETQSMLAAIKKGDKVSTAGGIRGTIHAVKDDTVIIRVDDNVKLEFNKSAVSSVNAKGKPAKSAKPAEEVEAVEEEEETTDQSEG